MAVRFEAERVSVCPRPFPWDLLVSLLVSVCLAFPFFNPHLWYDGDTVHYFEIFHTFYNHAVETHDLPRWLPYGTLGIQADYWQLGAITPSQYLVMLAGACLSITNAAIMFRLSVWLDLVFLAIGMHLLGTRIFHHRISRLFASLAILGSGIWLFNLLWNFRIYYLLPLIIYFLIRFFENRENRFLCFALFSFLAAQVGVTPYFACLNALLILIFFLTLLLQKPGLLKNCLSLRFSDIPLQVVALAAAAGYIYFAMHMLDFTVNLTPGREPGSLTVSLKNFLSFGEWTGPEKFRNLFIPGYLPLRMSIYLGLTPLVFFLFSLSGRRGPFMYPFLIVTILLVALTLGPNTPFAEMLYRFFPPLHFFRNIGLLGGPLRFFIAILAGYGCDLFLLRAKDPSKTLVDRLLLCVLTAAIFASAFFLKSLPPLPEWLVWPELATINAGIIGGFTLLVLLRWIKAPALVLLFTLALAGELAIFQKTFYETWPLRVYWLDDTLLATSPVRYQPVRGYEADLTPRMAQNQTLTAMGVSHFQKEISNFLLFDTYFLQKYPSFEWNTWLHHFLNISPSVCSATGGCNLPKLRLSRNITLAKNESEAVAFAARLDSNPDAIVLQNIPASEKVQVPATLEVKGNINVTSYSFNHLGADILVEDPEGSWLYDASAYHPGWKASVDSKPTPVYRANLAFRAIPLTQGSHFVRFDYWNGLQSFLGYGIAGFGLVFAMVLLGTGLKTLSQGKAATPKSR